MADKNAPVTLSTLKPARGSNKARMRVGRGPGSGKGKTSGHGQKGQKSRTGVSLLGFEGGQMPLYRRLPERGFTNPFKVTAQVVNVGQLAELPGTDVTPETLAAAGLIRRGDAPIKLLADGDVERAYHVSGMACSAAARSRIEAAGGQVEQP
jgi:large subunit ribosomal protein L15